MKTRFFFSLLLLASAGVHAQDAAAPGEEVPPVLVKTLPEPASLQAALAELAKYEFGQSRLSQIYIENLVLAAVGNEKAADLESALLPLLAPDAATPDARRFVCRMLGLVGGQRAADALAPLLQDPEYTAHALQALEGLGGALAPYVDALLAGAAGQAEPGLRGNLVMAMGRRGAASLPGLARTLYRDADPALRGTLADALAKLGTPEACSVLADQFFAEGADRAPLYPACAICAPVLAADPTNASRGVEWLAALLQPEAPAFVRGRAYVAAAALPAYEDADLEARRQQLLPLADGDNDIELMRARVQVLEARADGAAELAALAGSADPALQTLALEALARRKDAAGVEPAVAALASENTDVRASALRALTASGSDAAVDALFALAASEESKIAREGKDALTRLNAPGADERLAALARGGDAAAQAVAIEMLGLRRSFAQRAAAMEALASSDANVRSAAHAALRVIAEESDLPVLLDAALTADEASAKEYDTTVVSVAARLAVDRRLALLQERMAAASDPAQQARFVSLIGRVGGDAAFEVLVAAANHADPAMRLAAARGLSSWGEVRALDPLAKLLDADPASEAGKAAFDGVARILADNDVPSAIAMNHVQSLRRAAESDSDRRRLIQAINTVSDMRAFRIAESLVKEPALQSEAEQALVNLGGRLAGVYPVQVRARMVQIGRTSERDNIKAAAQKVSDNIARSRDFITSWAVSGPYRMEGKRANELYGVRFAPEDGLLCGAAESTGHLGWEIIPVSLTSDKPGYVDLEAEYKANECVAYLRTCFSVASATVGKLWIGSDDGCKVWHNGNPRLESLGMRHYVEGEDSILLPLDRGDHTIVIAVYQHASTWGFSARLTDAQGGKLATLTFNEPVQ